MGPKNVFEAFHVVCSVVFSLKNAKCGMPRTICSIIKCSSPAQCTTKAVGTSQYLVLPTDVRWGGGGVAVTTDSCKNDAMTTLSRMNFSG